MPFFKSLPQDAGVRRIVSLNPAAGRALIELHTAVLRNASAFRTRTRNSLRPTFQG